MAAVRGAPEVSLVDVTKRFGDIVAVRSVSLDIQRGEFFTLLGPSGSGKTTLLRMVGGFERPTSGAVYLRGEDVTAVPPFRRATSTVFQDLALFPHMTVGANVEYGLRVRKVPPAVRRQKALDMLRFVGLEGFYARNVNQLSGGQRQRVALARSLVVEPAVLLLDEPLTGLDEKLREQMQDELKSLQAKLGTTFIAVTHNQEEALSMSDRVAVVRDGRLEQVGTPRELYEAPRTEFVADFIGSANLLRGQVEVAEGGVHFRAAGAKLVVAVSAGAASPSGTQPGVLVVRPERITLGAAAEARENRCSGRVRGVTYKGAVTEIRVLLPDEQMLRVQVVAQGKGVNVEEGATITVGWDRTDAVLLYDEAREATGHDLAPAVGA